MLKINFNAETPYDDITPINVANALIYDDEDVFDENDLVEIADHLLAYVAHKKIKKEMR